MRTSGPGDTSGQRQVRFNDTVQVREFDQDSTESSDYEVTRRNSFFSRIKASISSGFQRIRELVNDWLTSLTTYVTRRSESPGARVNEYLNSDNDDLESVSSSSSSSSSSDHSLHLKPKLYTDEYGNEVDAKTYFGELHFSSQPSSSEKVTQWLEGSSPFSSSSSSSSSSDESIYETPRSSPFSSSSSSSSEEPIYDVPRRSGGGGEPIYDVPRRPGEKHEPIYSVIQHPTPGGTPSPKPKTVYSTISGESKKTPPAPPPKPPRDRSALGPDTRGSSSTQGSQKSES